MKYIVRRDIPVINPTSIYRTTEAMRLLRIGRGLFFKLLKEERLKSLRVGKVHLFTGKSLLNFANGKKN